MINEIVVICQRCTEVRGRNFPLAAFYRSAHVGDPENWWRLDNRARGGGSIDHSSGEREWYDPVSDKRRRDGTRRREVTQSGQVVDSEGEPTSTTYTIPCPKCSERLTIRAETIRSVCNAWAAAGKHSVSLADLRSAAAPRR